MATSFPTGLDTDTELFLVVNDVTDIKAEHHNNIKDAVLALEAKVGITSSAVTTSIDHHLGTAMFMQTVTADDTVASATWEDFAGLTMNVVVSKTSSVFLTLTIGNVTNDSGGARTSYAAIYWGVSPVEEATTQTYVAYDRQEGCTGGALASSVLKTGVTAATYVAKVKIAGSQETECTHTFTNGTLTAIVIPESL